MRGWVSAMKAVIEHWRYPVGAAHQQGIDERFHRELERRLDTSEARLEAHEQRQRIHILALETDLPRRPMSRLEST